MSEFLQDALFWLWVPILVILGLVAWFVILGVIIDKIDDLFQAKKLSDEETEEFFDERQ